MIESIRFDVKETSKVSTFFILLTSESKNHLNPKFEISDKEIVIKIIGQDDIIKFDEIKKINVSKYFFSTLYLQIFLKSSRDVYYVLFDDGFDLQKVVNLLKNYGCTLTEKADEFARSKYV